MAASDDSSDGDKQFSRSTRKTDLFGFTHTAGRFTCHRCSTEKHARSYSIRDIARYTRKSTVNKLVCLECAPSVAHNLKLEYYACTSCKKRLPRTAYSASMQKCRQYKKLKCESCQRCMYPPCSSGCGTNRPRNEKKYHVKNMLL
jgi:Na+-translocating ferredoxin:NAD+ oxidoreductase RNF subunit RnfB